MLGVNAKQLSKLLKAQSQTTKKANQIANQLIRDLEVQNGFGLANFLEVDGSFDNFTAIRVWIQKQIGTQSCDDFPDYDDLKHRFFQLVPEMI